MRLIVPYSRSITNLLQKITSWPKAVLKCRKNAMWEPRYLLYICEVILRGMTSIR